jgi:hypothetical protein
MTENVIYYEIKILLINKKSTPDKGREPWYMESYIAPGAAPRALINRAFI